MRVAEIYKSVQGEGLLTGVESIFVRASGCNLRCWFCDTPFASWRPEGEDLAVADIVDRVQQLDAAHVVLTGGEPMLFAELIPLCDRLQATGRHTTIETAGTLYLPVKCDLMSISPKLSNSAPSRAAAGSWRDRHESTRYAPDVLRKLIANYDYQLKFVVDTPDDCHEIQQFLVAFPEIRQERILLMPQGVEPAQLEAVSQWLEPYCDRHGYLFCPRRQIEWFGVARGT